MVQRVVRKGYAKRLSGQQKADDGEKTNEAYERKRQGEGNNSTGPVSIYHCGTRISPKQNVRDLIPLALDLLKKGGYFGRL